jgi:membrane-associated phospholipid phosphatase
VKSVLKSNILFLLPYFIFLLIGGIVLLNNTKASLHLTINSFHTDFLDFLFYYATYLGDGLVAILAVIILLLIKYRYAVFVGFSYSLSSLFTQLLKHTLFDDAVRPKKFFEGIHDVYFVPGVDNYMYNSFPSGHATTAFSLYFALALIIKNSKIKFLLFIMALLVSYSRIYLSQHFFGDVYAGSVIGVSFTFIVYAGLQKSKAKWLNGSFITSLKKLV